MHHGVAARTTTSPENGRRSEFVRLRDDELALSLARAIAWHVDRFPNAEVADYQAAIPEWSVAAITVLNGGFKQFFYNHRGGSPYLRRGRLHWAGGRA